MINYNTLISWNPTHLHSIDNSRGQFIDFYECPIEGGDAPIIAVCYALKMAAYTTFYDCDDMYPGSDYLPVFIQSDMVCEFQAPEKIDNTSPVCHLAARAES